MRRCSPASTGCRRTRTSRHLLLESLLESAKEICANPAMIAEEREKYNLLPDLPQELADGLADYYTEAIEAGVYSCDGGSEEAARTDLAVLSQAGQLEGSPDELAGVVAAGRGSAAFYPGIELAALAVASAALVLSAGCSGRASAWAGRCSRSPRSICAITCCPTRSPCR